VLLLAPVTDPAAIPHALAAALDLQVVTGDVMSACIALLAAGPGLLVIDNCEHLLNAVRDTVGMLLGCCPELTVLATSREPLGLASECTSRLAPLPLASAAQLRDGRADRLARVPSVAVFLDRAARVRPGFNPDAHDLRRIADIVRQLDGMPLAIELAAGRLSTFSLADLSARLDRALDLLGGGRRTADSRHRTLRATIAWSHDLLTRAEQQLFRHLSMFADGFDLDTAEVVAGDLDLDVDPGSALAHLVDASMIDATFEGPTRYRMLETLRAFGLDALRTAGEHDAAAQRLMRWAVELSVWIDATLATEREPEADAALRRELVNLRSAWRLIRQQGSLDDAATLVTTLADASNWRDLTELRSWAEELAGDDALTGHPRAAAPRPSSTPSPRPQWRRSRARTSASQRSGRHMPATSTRPAGCMRAWCRLPSHRPCARSRRMWAGRSTVQPAVRSAPRSSMFARSTSRAPPARRSSSASRR
jgi:predicted ATPase